MLRPKNIVAPAGWVAMADVSHRLFIAYMNGIQADMDNPFYKQTVPPDIDGVGRQYAMFWRLLRLVRKVALLGPDGQLAPTDKAKVLLRSEPISGEETENWSYSNEIFNLHECVVGSGIGSQAQPYHGYHILLEEKEVEAAFRELGLAAETAEGVLRPSSQSPKAISTTIIDWFDKGTLPKRADVKKLLAPNSSERQFGLAWGYAREQRPEISKPGRKSANPKT